jgi:hypothetical protein
MKEIVLDLSTLIDDKIDSISGRTFGEGYASKNKILEALEEGNIIVLDIDAKKIKAINDSFWKGFFSEVFKKYRTIDEVKRRFKFNTSDYFKSLIEKNLIILHSIFNS